MKEKERKKKKKKKERGRETTAQYILYTPFRTSTSVTWRISIVCALVFTPALLARVLICASVHRHPDAGTADEEQTETNTQLHQCQKKTKDTRTQNETTRKVCKLK